jgi:hypothetical protein
VLTGSLAGRGAEEVEVRGTRCLVRKELGRYVQDVREGGTGGLQTKLRRARIQHSRERRLAESRGEDKPVMGNGQ